MKLKLILSFLLISIMSINMAFSQTDTTRQQSNTVDADNYVPESDFRAVRLGIYGGIGLSWMKPKTTDFESLGSRMSYTYGLLIDYNFTKNYTFSSGVSFNSLGGKLSYPNNYKFNDTTTINGMLDRSYRINYIEIPTMLKLKTNQMGYFTYFAQMGVRHNFRVSSTGIDNFSYIDVNNIEVETPENEIDIQDYTSFYRLSFNFGFGAEYAISQTFSAFAFIGYDNGLTNSLSNTPAINGDKASAMLNQFGLTVGFLF